jgi:hypothetical protein
MEPYRPWQDLCLGLLPGLKAQMRSHLTLERCNDQPLALGDPSALIHPGAETENPTFGNNLTEYQPFSSFRGNKHAKPLSTKPKQEFVKKKHFSDAL